MARCVVRSAGRGWALAGVCAVLTSILGSPALSAQEVNLDRRVRVQFGAVRYDSAERVFVASGALADRVRKRRLLIGTQTALGCQALGLGALVASGHVEYWHVAVLAFCSGLVNVLDQPARQSLVAEMVGRADVASAVALNSASFNAARIVGPGLGGLLIAQFGVAPAFVMNGLGFAVAVIMLLGLLIAPAATVYLPCSSANIAILNPSPSSPTRFAAGTRASCNEKYPVLPARMPSLP